MIKILIILTLGDYLAESAYFNPQTLNSNIRFALNNFLVDQYDYGVIRTEVQGSRNQFGKLGISALQEFLQAKGRLPTNTIFNSLLVGTLQNYLHDLHLYHDEKPCGVFGPDTRLSLQHFLQRQRFYRYSRYKISANGNFDSKSVKLMQEFLSQPRGGGKPRYFTARIDGRWRTTTIKALREFLHDEGARVGFTRDYNKKYHFRKGYWGYKTSIVLQQYLVDHGYHLARVDGRFTSKSIFALSQFLNDYQKKQNAGILSNG